MKRKFLATALLSLCFLTCFAAFADFAGRWAGILTTDNGDQYPLVYNFKIDGDKLTGTGQSTQGVLTLFDGKITGNDFTFNLAVTGGIVKHICKYYTVGDSISIDIDYNGFKFHSTLKRNND